MANQQASDLEQHLWSAADSLRGSMDASEYKNYLLGLIFYRFLSENFEKQLTQITGENFNSSLQYLNSNNKSNQKEVNGSTPHDFLVTNLKNRIGYYIQPKALFGNLINKIRKHTFQLDDLAQAFQDLEQSTNGQTSEHDFKGLFDDVDLSSNRLGNSLQQKNKVISDVMLKLNDIDLEHYEGDVLGDAYEYLISQFASDAGKKAGEFYTPSQVSDIIAQIATATWDKNKDTHSIYDPAMGSGSLLLTIAKYVNENDKISYYGQELSTTTYNLARMNLMLHRVNYEDMDLRNGDTLDKDWPAGKNHQFDAVAMNPPYSAHWDNSSSRLTDPRFRDYGALPPKSKADFAFLLHGFYHLDEKGTMGIVLPHGVLFRGAKEGKIRKKLLQDNSIDAVIGLPEKIFHSTGIPTTIIILKKNKKNDNVLFIDASREYKKGKNQNIITEDNINKIVDTYKERKNVKRYAHVASAKEIEENDYNLNIPRYVDTFIPEPDIDINKEEQKIDDIDKEYAKVEKEFNEMKKDLVWTDKENKD